MTGNYTYLVNRIGFSPKYEGAKASNYMEALKRILVDSLL